VGEVTKVQRLTGKVAVLGCGYGSGAPTLLEALIAADVPGADIQLAHRAVFGWRRANEPTVRLWAELADAWGKAVDGVTTTVAQGWAEIAPGAKGSVVMRLPSGNAITYHAPQAMRGYDGRWQLSYERPAPGGGLKRAPAHSGIFMENLASALSRDILAHALAACHRAGLKVVLHVHDELVVEGSADQLPQLQALMQDLPAWARSRGLVLETAAEVVQRYTK